MLRGQHREILKRICCERSCGRQQLLQIELKGFAMESFPQIGLTNLPRVKVRDMVPVCVRYRSRQASAHVLSPMG